MKRRNFLCNILLFIFTFIFGYTVKKEGEDMLLQRVDPTKGKDEKSFGDEIKVLKELLTDIAVNVKTFGAVGDGIIDDTVAIQDALDYCIGLNKKVNLLFPEGKYRTTATILVHGVVNLEAQNAEIYCDHLDIGILCNSATGSFSNDRKSPLRMKISVTRSTFPEKSTAIGVKVYNCSYGELAFPHLKNHDIGLAILSKDGMGTSYTKVELGRFGDCVTGLLLKEYDTAWVTENSFYGGSFGSDVVSDVSKLREHIRFEGSAISHNNNNKFYSPSLEGHHPTGITFISTQTNRFYGTRMEMPYADNYITTDSKSLSNEIEVAYGISTMFKQKKFTDEGLYTKVRGIGFDIGTTEYYNKTFFEYAEKAKTAHLKRDSSFRHVSVGYKTIKRINLNEATLIIDLNAADHIQINPSVDITSIQFEGELEWGETKTIAFFQPAGGVSIEGFPASFLGQSASNPLKRHYGKDIYIMCRAFDSVATGYYATSQYRD
ncbi:glycosyl hydrolase family 28-related protein [Peribacillus frigoritolerans]|uniref:glycosyl hydrolase family 28-related protein n=1 Tax=Peribacillus frigoritolerans TaxID=450367 RepID=UPI00345D437C